MLDGGIVGVVKNKTPRFSFGFRGGSYLGSPGKDIYCVLADLSDEQKQIVAKKLADCYPKRPPGNHVKWAACIRYIYGCFEKQGCLRSKSDKKRMIDENSDWQTSMHFMDIVANCFKANGNKYGLVLHHEMLAHRFGDRAIIDKDNQNEMLQAMEENYVKSHEMGVAIKSWKHTFTPMYWAACYFYDVHQLNKSAKFHIKNLKYMEKYCPDAREGYREKAKKSLQQLRKCLTPEDYKDIKRWMKKCKNKCLVKVKKYA